MALSKLAVRRLTTLCKFMEKLPRSANKHFDMGAWFRHDGAHPLPNTFSPELLNDCGTVACAAGWACTIPSFRDAGLRLSLNSFKDFWVVKYGRYSTEDSFRPLERFFDVNEEQAEQLFGGSLDINTPKAWARRCRRFIAARGES